MVVGAGEGAGYGLDRPGGLLNWFTGNVFEAVLSAEWSEYLGHERGGTLIGSDTRNGSRMKDGADRDRAGRD